jgi:hypothetical protein
MENERMITYFYFVFRRTLIKNLARKPAIRTQFYVTFLSPSSKMPR